MIDAEQQAWAQAIRQKMAAYQDQTNQALNLATLHQALSYPRSWGPTSSLANPLLSRANNTATPLFQPANPGAGNVLNAYFEANAPGGNTIGLPGGDQVAGNQIDWSNPIFASLLGRSGVG